MKITFFDIEPWESNYLKEKLGKYEILLFENSINEATEKQIQQSKDSKIVSGFITSKFDKKTISKFEKLKAIITRSTGYDHINVKECKKRKIIVCNVPEYGENTVAEHTFGLILSLSRKIPEAIDKVKENRFDSHGLRGFDLKGKTIGIVGLGNIGQHVARMAKGFEMKILYTEPKRKTKLEKKLGAKFVKTTEELFSCSDIITFHVPLIKSTKHLLNKKSLKKVKEGAYIINTARGGIIDTTALIKGLNSGRIAGAGLDVLEEESIIKEEKEILTKHYKKEKLRNLLENHILMTYDNVIITPHNAFNSKEALERILDTSIENIKSIIKGKPENVVR